LKYITSLLQTFCEKREREKGKPEKIFVLFTPHLSIQACDWHFLKNGRGVAALKSSGS
jgi:hypothetical protein